MTRLTHLQFQALAGIFTTQPFDLEIDQGSDGHVIAVTPQLVFVIDPDGRVEELPAVGV